MDPRPLPAKADYPSENDADLDGYSQQELADLLDEGEASGIAEEPWEAFIRRLNVEYFGKETIG